MWTRKKIGLLPIGWLVLSFVFFLIVAGFVTHVFTWNKIPLHAAVALAIPQPQSQPQSTSTPPTSSSTYQFKLLQQADSCTLNTWGEQGWQVVQYGSALTYVRGQDEACSTRGFYPALDWVLLQKSVANIPDPSAGTTTYKYKLLRSVDACTMTKLGNQGWKPITIGTDDAGTSLQSVGGLDTDCQTSQYLGFPWALFELELTQMPPPSSDTGTSTAN